MPKDYLEPLNPDDDFATSLGKTARNLYAHAVHGLRDINVIAGGRYPPVKMLSSGMSSTDALRARMWLPPDNNPTLLGDIASRAAGVTNDLFNGIPAAAMELGQHKVDRFYDQNTFITQRKRMPNLIYGLRRMMGLTSPDEDEYQRQLEEREAFPARQPIQSAPVQPPQGLPGTPTPDRLSPGTVLRERSNVMDDAMQELQRQNGLRNINPSLPRPSEDPKKKPSFFGGIIRG